jgi:hypothetical protein
LGNIEHSKRGKKEKKIENEFLVDDETTLGLKLTSASRRVQLARATEFY